MLQVGDAFPDFSLPDQNGKVHTKADLIGKPALVYFYPKDDTPGCTTEACEIRESFPRFEGVTVFGVSPDGVESHRKFADKYDLPFTLLADEKHELAEACGVWGEKSLYGKIVQGFNRVSFLLDGNGIVTKVWPKVKAAGHAEEVLAALGS
jgi:peroxiredoxin Q/BCP